MFLLQSCNSSACVNTNNTGEVSVSSRLLEIDSTHKPFSRNDVFLCDYTDSSPNLLSISLPYFCSHPIKQLVRWNVCHQFDLRFLWIIYISVHYTLKANCKLFNDMQRWCGGYDTHIGAINILSLSSVCPDIPAWLSELIWRLINVGPSHGCVLCIIRVCFPSEYIDKLLRQWLIGGSWNITSHVSVFLS